MRRKRALFIRLTLCSIFFSAITSCHKTEIKTNAGGVIDKYTVTATLNGTYEPEQISSNAAGSLSGHFDESTNVLAFSLSWSNLSNVVQKIEIQVPANDPIPVTGFSYSRNGTVYTSVVLPANGLSDLLSGNYFVNIKTSTYPEGEIRGSIVTN